MSDNEFYKIKILLVIVGTIFLITIFLIKNYGDNYIEAMEAKNIDPVCGKCQKCIDYRYDWGKEQYRDECPSEDCPNEYFPPPWE